MTRHGKGKASEQAEEGIGLYGATPSSIMSRFLAAYDSGRTDEPETYFEVPSSHFLARPNGSAVPSSSADLMPSLTMYSSMSSALSQSGRSLRSATQHRLTADEITSSSADSFVTVQEHLHLQPQRSSNKTALSSDDIRSTASLLSSEERQEALLTNPMSVSNVNQELPAPFFGGHQARPHMPDTTTLAAADFDIDVRSGFLPPEEPLRRLQGIEEELWETALDRAHALPLRISGGGRSVDAAQRRRAYEWRRDIRRMLVLHPSPQLAADVRFARRAHLVLSFLAHFYIHSQPLPLDGKAAASTTFSNDDDDNDLVSENLGKFQGVVPASIAVPWVAVSRILDLPPVLTYATTVLWNWHLSDPARGFVDDNLEMSTTFSNTDSERHFYRSSLWTETCGVKALTLMRRSLDEAFVGDALALRRMRHYLRKLSRVIVTLQSLIRDIRTGCDPKVFYWGIRPWFNGCDSYVDKVTGEKGWIYEGVEEYDGRRMLFLGPSAGQSSLIHSIDVFLGVDHSAQTAAEATSSDRQNATFMERMQVYMPGHHRNFLTHLRSISFVSEEELERIRALAIVDAEEGGETSDQSESEGEGIVRVRETHPIRALLQLDESQQSDTSDQGTAYRKAVERLRTAYNEALTSLKRMRDEHMRIATLYIVSQMHTTPPSEYATLNQSLISTQSNDEKNNNDEVDAAAATLLRAKTKTPKSAKGTGGTDLVSFLKACRTNTVKAVYTSDQLA